jgi:magnesium-transporting ATPase (P-type)
LMQNSQKVRFKQSKLEMKMNRLIIYIVIVQAMLCIIMAVLGSQWYKEY